MKPIPVSRHLLSPALIEIHYHRPLFVSMHCIGSSQDANAILRVVANTNRIDLKEFFWVILLTTSNRVLGVSEIAQGTGKGVAVSVNEILQLALLTASTRLIVAHCHPSGMLTPSQSDLKITRKIKRACQLMEITLLDHLIITSEGYYSFCDDGLI